MSIHRRSAVWSATGLYHCLVLLNKRTKQNYRFGYKTHAQLTTQDFVSAFSPFQQAPSQFLNPPCLSDSKDKAKQTQNLTCPTSPLIPQSSLKRCLDSHLSFTPPFVTQLLALGDEGTIPGELHSPWGRIQQTLCSLGLPGC